MENRITKEEIEELKLELKRTVSENRRRGAIEFYMNCNLIDTKSYRTKYQRDEMIANWLKSIKGLMASFHKFHYIIKDVVLAEVKQPYPKEEKQPITKIERSRRRYVKPQPIRKKEPEPEIVGFSRPKAEYSNQRGYDYV